MPVGRRLAAALTRPYEGGETEAARIVARITAILSIAAGVIHFSAAGDHTSLPVMMGGFLVVAALQVALGALLLWRRPSRPLVAAAVALMLASVGIWLLSRTRGIPFLPDGHMEPVGFKDGITVFFELAAVPGLLLLLSRELSHVRLPSARLGTQAMSMAAVATLALMAPALLLEGGEHHSHEEAVALGIHGHDEEVHEGPGHRAGGTHGPADRGQHKTAHRQRGSGSHAGDATHTDPELAALHTGHGGSGFAPGSPAHTPHEAGGHDRHRSDRHRDSSPRHRHRGGGRDRHHGEREHGGDDPHAGHGDEPDPSDDEITLSDLPAVCQVTGAVTDVCGG